MADVSIFLHPPPPSQETRPDEEQQEPWNRWLGWACSFLRCVCRFVGRSGLRGITGTRGLRAGGFIRPSRWA